MEQAKRDSPLMGFNLFFRYLFIFVFIFIRIYIEYFVLAVSYYVSFNNPILGVFQSFGVFT
jgi:hypothetical protein